MRLIFMLALFVPTLTNASSLFDAKGFHWYNLEKERAEQKIKELQASGSSSSSMYQKLMQKRAQAKESLATALLKPSVEHTTDYMRRQKEYQDLNTQFVRNWKIALLLHPELDASLEHPVDNNAIAIRNDEQAALMEKVIGQSHQSYGLLLFYKGNSNASKRFAQAVTPYIQGHKISMISASTDGQTISSLPNNVLVSQEKALRILNVKGNYQPALFLVNLKNKQIKPVSYGFVSLSEFKQRYFDVLTNYSRMTDEGTQL